MAMQDVQDIVLKGMAQFGEDLNEKERWREGREKEGDGATMHA
jgi:hypothetical protein